MTADAYEEEHLREIPLHDPNRSTADWAGCLSPTEVAAMFCHAKSGVPVTPRGEPVSPGTSVSCLVFETLAEAETFCRELCEKSPRVRCEIFDARGKSVPPLLTITNPQQDVSAASANRRIRQMRLAAGCLMSLSFPLCIWDYHRDWALIMPTFLGINCFVISLRLFHWAHMEREALREREAPSQT